MTIQNKDTENNKISPPVEELQDENVNLWAKEDPSPHKLPKRVKKKYKWGMPEVLIAIIVMLVTQIAMALIAVTLVVSKEVANGISDPDDIYQSVSDFVYNPIFLIVSGILMYISWAGTMWYSTKFRGHKSWSKDFWFKFKAKDLGIGLIIGGLGFGLVQGLSALLEALGVNMSEASNTQPFTAQEGVWRYVLFIGLVSLIGPFMEELFFRGFLMQALIKHFRRGNISSPRGALSAWMQFNSAFIFNKYVSFRNFCYKHKYLFSAIISSIMFGFMHYQGNSLGQMMIVAITGLLGFLFACVTIYTRRLGPAIVGHMSYNGTIAVITLMSMS